MLSGEIALKNNHYYYILKNAGIGDGFMQDILFSEILKKCADLLSMLICYFLRKTQISEQTPITMVHLSDNHFRVESTEAMRITFLAQGHNILMLPGFEPSIVVFRNHHPTNMTSMFHSHKFREILYFVLFSGILSPKCTCK